MKQTLLMMLLLLVGTVGPFAFGPFIGLAIYYLFAILRPQFLWEWVLPADFGWSFYVAICTIIATWFYLGRSLREKMFSWPHAVMLGFGVMITLSHLFALNIEVSSRWYWDYLKLFIMFFVGTLVVRELLHVKILYLIAVLALGYIAYEVNFLYLAEGRMDIYLTGFGGLDNNGAGLMLAMGIPMAYFLWQGYDGWKRWFFLALVLVMLHAVLLSFSRGAMVALVVVVPFMIRRSLRKAGMVAALIGLIFILPILAGKEIRERFFSVEQYEVDRTAQSRFQSWRAAWNIAKDYPLFGVGLRNSDFLSYRYGADVEGRTIHSLYLQTAADSGLPAAALYLLLLYGTWKALKAVRMQHRESATEEDRLAYNIAAGLESALVVFCVGALFLSLELFELPFLIILLALKLQVISYAERVPVAYTGSVPELSRQTGSYAGA